MLHKRDKSDTSCVTRKSKCSTRTVCSCCHTERKHVLGSKTTSKDMMFGLVVPVNAGSVSGSHFTWMVIFRGNA